MKKTILYSAPFLTLITVVQPANAQGSVTLYGIIDAGIAYTSNLSGHSAVQARTGGLGGNRWGLSGKEDLGGGLSAIFTLENGFNAMNGALGQAGRIFGRKAIVGLSSADYGTVTLGRQYTADVDLISNYFGSGFWVPATHIGDNDNFDGSVRYNNSVKYLSPMYAGLIVEGFYAFSNAASGSQGGFGNNSIVSAAANYAHGPLSFGAGYTYLNHPNSKTNTNGATGGASSSNGDDYSGLFFYGIDGGVTGQQIVSAGIGYTLDSLIAGFGYSNVQLDYVDGASRHLNNYDANVRYRITRPLQLIVDYTYTDGKATGLPGALNTTLKPKWHQLTLAAIYALSKRTDVYVSGEYQIALGDGSTLTGGTYQRIAAIPAAGSSSNNRQFTVEAGLRHKF